MNPDSQTLTAIDVNTNDKVFEVETAMGPASVAADPDGYVWVVGQQAGEVAIHRATDGALVDEIQLHPGSRPFGLVFSPNGEHAFVSLESAGAIVRIDPSTRAVTGRLALPISEDVSTVPSVRPPLRGLAVDARSTRLFVARFISPRDRGEIYEIDPDTMQLRRAVSLAKDPGPDTPQTGRGVPNYLSRPLLALDNSALWMPSKKDNIERGIRRDGRSLHPENTVRTILSKVVLGDELGGAVEDLASRVDFDDQDMAFAATTSPAGDLIYVVVQGSNQLNVLDAYTEAQITGAATGLAPQGVVEHRGRLYVQNLLSRSVSVFDVRELQQGSGATVRRIAEVPTVGVELLRPEVLRGKRLFYASDSKRMSLNGYLSCATCHLDGGQDGRVWDFTDRGEGFRNTITLRGRAGMAHGPVHWTGNFDEIQDFEGDIRAHFGGRGLISDTAYARGTVAEPLGNPKAGLSSELDALAAYAASLDFIGMSPYREPNGALSASAERGRAIYASLDCSDCHRAPRYTDSSTGTLHDVGTISPSSGGRLGKNLTGLDTPTLKGLWNTAPYLHDGSAQNLIEVLNNPLHGGAANLSNEEKRDLASFLLTLDDAFDPRIVEAEDAALSGTARGRFDAGFSGSGYVDYPAETGEEIRIRWHVVSPVDGRVDLTFRYANGDVLESPRPQELRVNDQVVARELSFPPSGAWNDWRTVTVPSVALRVGTNHIDLVALTSKGPNVDYLKVSPRAP